MEHVPNQENIKAAKSIIIYGREMWPMTIIIRDKIRTIEQDS